MTNYTDKEYSIDEGSPIEAYRFTGTLSNYFYTSAETIVTISGQDYAPIAISHSPISVTSAEDDSTELEVHVPYDLDIVQDYVYRLAPFRLLLEIFRYHEGTDPSVDFVIIWKGYVTLYSVDGPEATLRVPSIFSSLLQGEIPNIWYHQPCNHVLFDSRCGLVRDSFKTITTIVSVDGYSIEVATDGAVNGYLRGGDIYIPARGERRIIMNNINDVLAIRFPFRDAAVGDTVELCTGCEHIFTTCRDKFDNAINYGGFPYIPWNNPFEGDI